VENRNKWGLNTRTAQTYAKFEGAASHFRYLSVTLGIQKTISALFYFTMFSENSLTILILYLFFVSNAFYSKNLTCF